MTAPTITGGIRISPQLWAEFGLYAASKGKTRNFLLVDMIRERVVAERVKGGGGVSSLIGSVWRERDSRFTRLVEVVSDDGDKIGRRTLSFSSNRFGTKGKSERVTYGDRTKFLKGFERDTTTHSAKEE